MLTFTGIHVTKTFGAPSLRDIAVQSMRMARFNGAGRVWWPIGMHLLYTADLINLVTATRLLSSGGISMAAERLEVHALLHDAAELSGIGDISHPLKTTEQRILEHIKLDAIYDSLGLELPTEFLKSIVKLADDLACSTEGFITGPPGFIETHSRYEKSVAAETMLNGYLCRFDPKDAINPDGKWPLILEQRLRKTIARLQKKSDGPVENP